MIPQDFIILSVEEKARRFEEMALATFSHLDGRDLLQELHPRNTLDIKRRVDGVESWYQADWLSTLMKARNGQPISEYHKLPTSESKGE